MNIKLTNPPDDDRARELWMQHTAGFILFRDMRDYAIKEIPDGTDKKTKSMVINGIDNAIYGLMMIMDGVVGTFGNKHYQVSLENNIVLEKDGEIIQKINTFYSDGMCMGFHGWLEGDFGRDDIYTNES
jgi:hypothetical protein